MREILEKLLLSLLNELKPYVPEIALIETVLGVLAQMVPAETLATYLTDDARARARALADAIDREKFPGG
jgi:hypothetical protein